MTRRQAEKRGWSFTLNDAHQVHQASGQYRHDPAVARAEKRHDGDLALEVGVGATADAAEAKLLAAIEKTETRFAARGAAPKPRVREGSIAHRPAA